MPLAGEGTRSSEGKTLAANFHPRVLSERYLPTECDMLLHTLFLAAVVTAAPSDTLPCGSMPAAQVEKMDYLAFFADEASAEAAAGELDASLFEVSVRTAASEDDWVLRAVYRELPTPEAHARIAPRVESAVTANGGRQGGFGCQSAMFRRSDSA